MSKVPAGWDIKPLEAIAKITSGGTPSRANLTFWNGNIPWVTTAEVHFNEIKDTNEKITKTGLDNSSAKVFPSGTLLMAMYGQGKTRGQVAKLGIDASTNQACAAILLLKGYSTDYYYLYLESQYENLRDMSNSGGQKNLSAGLIKSLLVPVPPLSEQTKIAQILSTWDKAIATTEQLISNSQQQKKALMQSLLTGKKRLPGFEGELRLYSFSDVSRIDKDNLNNKTLGSFSFKYISLSDVKVGVIAEKLECFTFENAPSRARRIIKEGDILLATVRPNLQGFARIEKQHEDMIASTGFSVLSPKELFCSDYIYHYLFSDSLTSQIDSLVVGSNYPAINSSDVANLQILCPDYNEQIKIAEVLDNCANVIETLQKKLAFLKQEKTALMQQLLTGKRRVKVEAA
ncbi:restriction endonuclease subunit S [Budvicia aquatica]|uniref:Restriction endonuclease subunit S n=1 Tax=Budvicia aquatica TaxID=82979 RepID=A0A2C6DDT9_9GAMM|nr:restriction endonuclease subunit S [Budvicia aquatica]PHI28468.1 restriction endonuclease subunit S [Budvicia aquatica]VFS46404.1 Type I restriction enzyme EcoKI specificity protein [Budvicia aquatica]